MNEDERWAAFYEANGLDPDGDALIAHKLRDLKVWAYCRDAPSRVDRPEGAAAA